MNNKKNLLIWWLVVIFLWALVFTFSDYANPEYLKCKSEWWNWVEQGLAKTKMCVKDYDDGWKVCNNSDECKGDCIAKTAEDTAGKCQMTNSEFWCFQTIENFKNWEWILCRD